MFLWLPWLLVFCGFYGYMNVPEMFCYTCILCHVELLICLLFLMPFCVFVFLFSVFDILTTLFEAPLLAGFS